MYLFDEGYIDDEHLPPAADVQDGEDTWVHSASLQAKEDLAYKLLSSLPISSLARVQRKIAPLLQMDIVGLLPTEISLSILSFLQYHDLLCCSLVSSRWRVLANDASLWKRLCGLQGWEWRESPRQRVHPQPQFHHFDDEGVGDDEDDWPPIEVDLGFVSMSRDLRVTFFERNPKEVLREPSLKCSTTAWPSSPSLLESRFFFPVAHVNGTSASSKPDYKLLHQTHILLRNRLLHSSYRLTYLQNEGTQSAHTALIYCMQLHTFPAMPGSVSRQVLFTGSRDKTICQWNLSKKIVERTYQGVHDGSVLSICIQDEFLISGGSDRKVVVWNLKSGEVVKVIEDHLDSVLCVRADKARLVTCSKDRTIRTYLFPDLTPHLVLASHRAAVNAISISSTQIVSASGDRSVRVWDAKTGETLHIFEQHHSRGIASIDFSPPYITSGSSDKHVRYFNTLNSSGWSTFPHIEPYSPTSGSLGICEACGNSRTVHQGVTQRDSISVAQAHKGLVRSVAFGDTYVVSGSYDHTVKVWDRRTGNLIVDLKGGHNGRVFCVAADCTKIISCGEDLRICIWDFAHGISTSFIKL